MLRWEVVERRSPLNGKPFGVRAWCRSWLGGRPRLPPRAVWRTATPGLQRTRQVRRDTNHGTWYAFSVTRLLTRLGCNGEPFSKLNAENEPELDQYFVKAPYYATVSARAAAADTFVLFGARGSGKSATRIAAHREIWCRVAREESAPLAITLDSYERILAKGLDAVTANRFVEDVAFLVVGSVLLWLSNLDSEDRDTFVGALNDTELTLAASLVRSFYLPRPESLRSMVGTQTLRAINYAWIAQGRRRVPSTWASVASTVVSMASKLAGLKAGGPAHQATSTFPRDDLRSEITDARGTLDRLVAFARSFGFAGIVALVDKADETSATNNSATNAAQLLYPILSSTHLLEMDGFGWVFFLWDKVRDEYTRADKFKIRLDKLQYATIAWSGLELGQLVTKRLDHYSGGKLRGFEDLCRPQCDAAALLNEIISVATRSPRELVKAMDTIVRQYDEGPISAQDDLGLDADAVAVGLDAYCAESVPGTYPAALLAPVLRLRLITFVNKDVQQSAHVAGPSAGAKIQKWVDAGLVGVIGQRPAEGGAGGKPAVEYGIIDSRVVRVIQRGIRMPDQIEMMLEHGGEESESDDEQRKTSAFDPIEVFYSYSQKDEAFREALETHLKLLQRQGLVATWHDRKIMPGSDRAEEIDSYLERADLILLLVSADFIASDYCFGRELSRALEREIAKEARVVPIILRPTDLTGAPFMRLQALPKDAKPITKWEDRDDAWTDVASGIRRVIEELRASRSTLS